MANVSSVGIGSGVLTSDLIDQLVEAERAPTESRLTSRQDSVTAELSLFAQIQSAVTDLRLPARRLANADTFSDLTATSGSSAFSASASSAAVAGSYTLEVNTLAKSQSLSSGTFANTDTVELGEGTLSFTINGTTTAITIDSSNNTLDGVASAINESTDLAASATIIDNGSGYQLVVTSNAVGADNAIDIAVTDNDGDNTDVSGLSQLSYTLGAERLTQNQAATDASFNFNGIPITRGSNTVDDLVEGLTITLSGTNAGAPARVELSQDVTGIVEKVEDFVEKYNALRTLIVENSQVDPGNPAGAGLLVGDAATRAISTQLRNVLGQTITGLNNDPVRGLSEAGITTDRETGNLLFDENVFKNQLAANPKSVEALFADQGRSTDGQVEFVLAGSDTVPGEYSLNVTQVATRASLAAGGAPAASTIISSANENDEFTINVDGVASSTITLDAGTYTQEQLALEIQEKINADPDLIAQEASVTVSVGGGGALEFFSNRFGSKSSIEILSVDTNTTADLGFSDVAGIDGLDVAGTINGQVASGDGQILSGAAGSDVEGLLVRVTGGTTGDRGEVSYIEGVGEKTVDLINNFLANDGTITAKNERLNAELDSIAESRAALNERLLTLETRLVRQFTAADILIAQLNSTQDFIKGQLEALAGIGQSE